MLFLCWDDESEVDEDQTILTNTHSSIDESGSRQKTSRPKNKGAPAESEEAGLLLVCFAIQRID